MTNEFMWLSYPTYCYYQLKTYLQVKCFILSWGPIFECNWISQLQFSIWLINMSGWALGSSLSAPLSDWLTILSTKRASGLFPGRQNLQFLCTLSRGLDIPNRPGTFGELMRACCWPPPSLPHSLPILQISARSISWGIVILILRLVRSFWNDK